MSKGQKIFLSLFFGIFLAAGIALMAFGFVKLAKYNFAEEVEATVISAKYNAGEMDVTFEIERGGETVQTAAHYDKVTYGNDGRLPYYEGKQVTIRIDKYGKVMQYGRTEIIMAVGGVLFAAAGAGFGYFTVFRKRNLVDVAYEYEQSMILPEEAQDDTATYEAQADQLSKLPSKSPTRMFGEAGVWKNRIADRFKTYTVLQNIIICTILFVPMILLGIYPLFFGKSISLGGILFGVIAWLFVFCFVGLPLKAIRYLYFKISVKAGKFSEKRLATVKQCAFESALQFQSGEFSRSYVVFKKFRVVADIDGKRSVGYVKGNVPPPKGAVLKVLIRPNRPKNWIIDNTVDFSAEK